MKQHTEARAELATAAEAAARAIYDLLAAHEAADDAAYAAGRDAGNDPALEELHPLGGTTLPTIAATLQRYAGAVRTTDAPTTEEQNR